MIHTALRSARRNAGLTLTQAADRAAVSVPALARAELGKSIPQPATLRRILKALGVYPAYAEDILRQARNLRIARRTLRRAQ